MNAKECNYRASECATNAAESADELISLEFLRMAAHWRAMAVAEIYVGNVAVPAERRTFAPDLTLPITQPKPIA
jgi:hypothetical protein